MEKNFTNATKLENSLAHKIRRQIAKGNYKKATASYGLLQNIISNNSNNVVIISLSLSLSLSLSHTHTIDCRIVIHVLDLQDFYNFLLDSKNDPVTGNRGSKGKDVMGKYSEYLSTKKYSPSGNEQDLPRLMNGPIRKKLKIIPKNVT